MDPFTMYAISVIVAKLILIYVAFLVVSRIISWFQTKARNSKIRATFKEDMKNGQYKIVAVGLDSNHNVQTSIGYKADDIDSDLYNAHYDSKVVVWT